MVEVGVTQPVRTDRSTSLKVAAGNKELTAVMHADARIDGEQSGDKQCGFSAECKGFHGVVVMCGVLPRDRVIAHGVTRGQILPVRFR